MTRRPLALLAFAALALLLVVATAAAQRGAPAKKAGSRFTVIERATTDTTTDTGKKGDSVGDVLTFHNKLYNRADRKVVGRDQGACIRVDVGTSYECHWTNIVRGGQIVVEGPFYDTKSSTLAIIGGTGRYRAARGEMRLVSRKGGKEFAFTFRVTR